MPKLICVPRCLSSDDTHVVGVLTVDDLLIDLINDLGDVVRPVTGEVIFGHHDAPLPGTTTTR
jgi:hypothetical protein